MAQLILHEQNQNNLRQAAHQLASCTDKIFQEIEQQQTLNRIIGQIRSCQSPEQICKIATDEISHLLKADRVAIFKFDKDSLYQQGEFIAEKVLQDFPSVLKKRSCDLSFSEQFSASYSQGNIQAIADINQSGILEEYLAPLREFQVRANLVVPILKNSELWGLICVHSCSQRHRWTAWEIEIVQTISEQCGIALQLTDQIEQIRDHTTLVVKLKAQEKALRRQKSLVKISNRIRQSFEFKEICNTATQEARNLLDCSRIAIYKFNPDWSGEFTFENYDQEWNALVGSIPPLADTHIMQTQGDQFKPNQAVVIEDIYKANYPPCYIKVLEGFQAKAYINIPIFQREKLWGLLAAFQNNAPRIWQADEVELLMQIAEQIGIALGQAQSFQEIKQQSHQLQVTLEQLQLSQAELIEKEKMAALGKLIAGVAHEINNPLGAIHASASNTQDALKEALVELPKIHRILDDEQRKIFYDLIHRSMESEPFIASAQSRSVKRQIIRSFKEEGIEDARAMAELLMDMGVYSNLDSLMSLLKSKEGAWALKIAYNLTCSNSNNETIIQAVERSSKIVFALKNYTRNDQSKTAQWIDIGIGIDTTLKLYHNQLKRNVQIYEQYERSLPAIRGYPDELIQIWTNLIHNAIQAMEDGGSLCIRTQSRNQGVEIDIQDSGPGIPPEILDQVFNPFFTTKPVGKGSGLGLYICQKIVHKHHGKISVQSEPGRTQFKVWLPYDFQRSIPHEL